MDVGFEILPKDGCSTCQRLDDHRHVLNFELVKAVGRIADLEEQNRHDDEADTACRNLLMEENDCLRRRIAELEEELRNISEADYHKWADDMNTPYDFVRWAQSRARHTLNLK